MKWPWLVALVLPGGLILVIGHAVYRRLQRDHVSDQWLEENFRRGLYNTYEGVNWKFPVNKIVNEAGRFNAQRLRKRA